MRFLCLAYYDVERFDAQTEEQWSAIESQCEGHDAALRATGKLVAQLSLASPDTAATIRPERGRPLMMDGPFLEAKEQIGGAFIIEAESLSEALQVASRHPAAWLGEEVGWGIEVRAIELFDEA